MEGGYPEPLFTEGLAEHRYFLDEFDAEKNLLYLGASSHAEPINHAFLTDRSPKTDIENISAPMLVIQGKNDPRVVERESRDVVEKLRGIGKDVEYLMFEDEGHDMIKFENKTRCYNAITDYFTKYLLP